jgi:hypothetical protein
VEYRAADWTESVLCVQRPEAIAAVVMTVITVWREPLSHVPSLCISITGQFVCNRRTVDRCFGVQLVYSQRVILVGIVRMVGLQAK